LLLEHVVVLFPVLALIWTVLEVNRSTDHLHRVAFTLHRQVSRVPLESVPNSCVVVLVLGDDVGVRECHPLGIFVTRVVACSRHVTSGEIEVLVSPRFYEMVISRLKLSLQGFLCEKCRPSWSIPVSQLLGELFMYS